MPRFFRALVALFACTAALPAIAFDRAPWLDDYAWLKHRLEADYSHLAWFASTQGGVDLPALDRRTLRALETAENDADASAAIVAFAQGFHDGHFSQATTLERTASAPVAADKAPLAELDAANACAALGYAPANVAFSLPFEVLRGTSLETDGIATTFRTAVTTLPDGRRVGIVRLQRFREQDYGPAACLAEWSTRRAGGTVDVTAAKRALSQGWYATLAAILRHWHEAGVAAVLVDVGRNGGGDDSGDWTARLFTPRDVRSARLLVAASPSSARYFDEQIDGLRDALKAHPQASRTTKRAARAAQKAFEKRKASLATKPCDLAWAWRERRTWDASGCLRLADAGHASGELAFLAPAAERDRDVASAMYWPTEVDAHRGAWSGPVYVLTDDRTHSSAEMFSAVMRDNGIAKTLGTTTGGSGCGFMLSDDPLELPHSHLRFRVPNCVRLRADGTDEVAGIAPDIAILPTQGEDGSARAARALREIAADLTKNTLSH